MTATEFNKLTLEQRGVLLTENSIFLDERFIYGKHKVIMYALFNFYVEVYYHIELNEIQTVKALENTNDWEGYIQSINIKHLLQ